jgi:hypothetical protein
VFRTWSTFGVTGTPTSQSLASSFMKGTPAAVFLACRRPPRGGGGAAALIVVELPPGVRPGGQLVHVL